VTEQRELTVLTSTPRARSTTNPYVVELNRRLSARVHVLPFSWRALLLARWDVIHMHWPDALVGRPGRCRSLVATALLALGILRARLTGRRIVRTVHNVTPHETQPVTTRAVLRLLDRSTAGWIRLNDHTPTPGTGRAVTIPHGTYSAWFARSPHPDRVAGRLLCAGLVRPYKGVEDLLRVFGEVPDRGLTLHVCGHAPDAGYGDLLRATAEEDPRVTLDLRRLSDDELATQIGEASLVVLPYRQFHNSGIALLALSLGRPVLVPDNPVTRDLETEMGAGWVMRFTGDLNSADLGFAAAEAVFVTGAPNLAARDWDRIADAHVALFRAVMN
jgi:beta-1,4-mannosyltransferase